MTGPGLWIPIPAKDAGSVASGLLDEFVSRFGFPGELYSDQGKEFCNQVFVALSDLGNITMISPHPTTLKLTG